MNSSNNNSLHERPTSINMDEDIVWTYRMENYKNIEIKSSMDNKRDYGKTAFSVKDDLNTTQEEAQKLIDIIKAKTPVKQRYFNYWINFVMEHGYIIIDNVTKRRTWFYKYDEFKRLKQAIESNRDKKLYSMYSKVKGELERFAQNYKIQGTGGSMTKLASIYFYDEIEKRDLWNKVWLVNLVHDELVPECNKQYSELAAQLVQEAMLKAGSKICKTIPMIAEPNISQTWNK